MAHHLSIDLETYSSVDLKKSGMFKYIESPDYQILLFAYSIDGEPVQVIDLATGEQIPPWLAAALRDPGFIKHAYKVFRYAARRSMALYNVSRSLLRIYRRT